MRPHITSLFLLIGALLAAQTTSFEKLDTYFDLLEENNQFMGTVVLKKGDSLLFQKAMGKRDMDQGRSNNIQTIFRLGSISKMFTSTMIFQLIEEGKLSLDTTLAEFFPLIPNSGTITIQQMLRHNSGLFDFTSDPSYGTYMFAEQSRATILTKIQEGAPAFVPGEQVAYCNSNFVLLSYIIEDLDELSYGQSLEKRITSKIYVPSITYGAPANTAANDALSYMYTGEFWQASGETDMSIPSGAGAVVGNAIDVSTFVRTLLRTGVLLSNTSKETMLETIGEGFGYGIFSLPFEGITAYGHGGSIDGFRTRTAYLLEKDITATVLSNGLNMSMSDITDTLIAVINDDDFALPLFADIEIPEDQLSRYPGTYTTEGLPISLVISTKNGKVVLQVSGQQAITLNTESETEFTFASVGVKVTFGSLENNLYQELLLEQGGGNITFKRKTQ